MHNLELCDGSDGGISARSKLKISLSRRYWMLRPRLSGGMSWRIVARYIEKSAGARTQPCFIPDVMGNSSVSLLS